LFSLQSPFPIIHRHAILPHGNAMGRTIMYVRKDLGDNCVPPPTDLRSVPHGSNPKLHVGDMKCNGSAVLSTARLNQYHSRQDTLFHERVGPIGKRIGWINELIGLVDG
jgi:hypothetical protein